MKRLLTLMFILPCITFMYAQTCGDYCPFIEEGKIWNYKVCNPNSAPEYYQEWFQSYWIKGDTAIAKHICSKLYMKSNCSFNEIDQKYIGALYEKDSKIYLVADGNDTPHLLYDFSCQKGESVIINGYELIVQNRCIVSYNSTSRILLECSPKVFDLFQLSWIEGVGAPNGFLEFIGSWNPGSYRYQLLNCKVNGNIIFDYQTFKGVVTGIQPSLKGHITQSVPFRHQCFDLAGRRLAASPAKGVYIQNGKKKAVK